MYHYHAYILIIIIIQVYATTSDYTDEEIEEFYELIEETM